MNSKVSYRQQYTRTSKVYPHSDTQEVRIYTLGQFVVERRVGSEWHACDNSAWQSRRARALLGCLLSSPEYRLGREQALQMLWADQDRETATNRLNGAVHELRLILEPELERPAASRLLLIERNAIKLARSTYIWVDADAFEALLKEAESAPCPEQAERLLEEAAALYGGSYLIEELYAEWAAPRRDRLQSDWINLVLALADLRSARGAFSSAIEVLDRLRMTDPTNEVALQRLMTLLTQLNRRGEALQVYRQHVVMLRRDYESEPWPETLALYRALQQGSIPASYIVGGTPRRPLRTPDLAAKQTASGRQTPGAPETRTALSVPKTEALVFLRPAPQQARRPGSSLVGREHELETMRQTLLALEGTLPGRTESGHAEVLTSNGIPITSVLSRDTGGNGADHRGSTAYNDGTQAAKRPHFLLLMGEPGIGKTRLVEELSLEAHTRNWAVAWGRADVEDVVTPYRPWTEILHTLLQGVSTEHLAAQTELRTGQRATPRTSAPDARDFASLLEHLSTLLPERARQDKESHLQACAPPPPADARLSTWEATLGLLSLLSTMHPLLLVLDDLHWADECSLELLTYLARHLDCQRILFVGTYRDSELAPAHRLNTLFTNLQREQVMIALPIGALTLSQIKTIAGHLPEAAVQRIQVQAAGNPLFAEALARQWSSDSRTEEGEAQLTTEPSFAHSDPTVPTVIREALEHRLSRLSSPCQALLRRAAILGRSFQLGQVLAATCEHDEEIALDLIEEALRAGLLVEEGTGASISYRFLYPLLINHLSSSHAIPTTK